MKGSAAIRPRRIRSIETLLATLAACALLAPAQAPAARGAGGPGGAASEAPRPRLGFLSGGRDAERRAEQEMLSVPTPERERAWLHALTEEPHVAGTPQGKKLAEYVRDRLVEFGLKTEMVTYDIWLNHPLSVSLKLLKPEAASLSLREEGYIRDKSSYSEDAFPGFHGYGASGKASGKVVYVNYGTREDFERLESLGLPVEGRIVIVRYGKVFRGLKVKEAEARGARAVIIYSDPADDGYMKGDIYPDGPMRPASSLQRGSVQFLSSGPGDPSTPGYASTKNARRVAREQMSGIPKIPSLPLSYGEAAKILKALAGDRVPDDWQGGLPFAYHLGPGPAEAEMSVEMDYAIRPLYDVIATIPGTAEPDRLVVLGNHRDAWTYGAVDPNSGTASLLETARGLAAALKAGWKPRRTILLASWDGEEYGLLGSTEWVEDRGPALLQNGVAYINLDSAVTGGDLDVSGIPSLRDLIFEAAGDVDDPRHGGSVLDAWRSRRQRDWAKTEPACPRDETTFELHLNPLGSGSDYTAFADHAGIASADFTFDGPYGVYPSIYDDLFWMEHFGDPEFLYHTAASRLYGLLAMRLGAADIVPLRYGAYGRALSRELELLRREAVRDRRVWEAARTEPRSVEPGSQAAVEARKKPALVPDFSSVAQAIDRLTASGIDLDAVLDRLQDNPDATSADPQTLARLNDTLVQVERAFLDKRGLPGRPWFQHTLYAPGLTTGYASWPFPGIVQALKDRDADELQTQIRVVVDRIDAGAGKVGEARDIATGIGRK